MYPAPALREPLPAHYADHHCRIVRVDHVIVSLWTRPPVAHQIDAMRSLQRAITQEGGAGFGSLTLIQPAGGRITLSDSDRAAMRDLVVRSKDVKAWNALVVEGSGLMVAAARTVVAAVLRLVPTEGRTRSFAARAEAAGWLAAQLIAPGAPSSSLRARLLDVAERATAELSPPSRAP